MKLAELKEALVTHEDPLAQEALAWIEALEKALTVILYLPHISRNWNEAEVMVEALETIVEAIETPKAMDVANIREKESKKLASIAATELGKLGGKARSRNMTPERRSEIARIAAEMRWKTRTSKEPNRL